MARITEMPSGQALGPHVAAKHSGPPGPPRMPVPLEEQHPLPKKSPANDFVENSAVRMQMMMDGARRSAFNKPTHGGARAMEDQKVAELSEVIRTYRGLDEDEEEHEADRPWCDRPWFDVTICSIIVLNMFVIGLEVDLEDNQGYDRMALWIVLQWIFCLIFIAEIVIKVYFHSWRWFFRDIWSWLALFIAALAFFDAAIFAALETQGSLRMFSLIRVVALVRLKKIIENSKEMKELMLIIRGLMGSLPSLAWAVLILILILYIFSIWMTTLIGKNHEKYEGFNKVSGGWDNEELFGTIGKSLFTLVQVMTLDTWHSGIARQVITMQWYMVLLFVIFIMTTTYGIMNLIIAIIVEQTLTASSNSSKRVKTREERARKAELESIREIFMLADEDCSGELTREEFLEACEDSEVQWRLRQLELPIDDARRLFEVIDGEGSRALTMSEFIAGCTKIKGAARSQDMLALQSQADHMSKRMDRLGQELQESEYMLAALDEATHRMITRFHPALIGSRRAIAESVAGAAPIVPLPPEKAGCDGRTFASGNEPLLPNLPNLLG